jgi:outer membrane protein TolC
MRADYEHAIATLIGKPPAQFSIAFAPQTPLQLPVIPVGLPTTLLERRPDIAADERRVAEANDQIGIAQTAYYPSLDLGAAGGFAGTTVANWLTWPSRMWAVGGQMSETLYDAGRRRSVVDAAKANCVSASRRQSVRIAHS